MPIVKTTNVGPIKPPIELGGRIVRRLFVRDKDGVEIEIKTDEDLQKILAQMTPDQQKTWMDNYRFTPIQNLTGIIDYTGTIKDLL